MFGREDAARLRHSTRRTQRFVLLAFPSAAESAPSLVPSPRAAVHARGVVLSIHKSCPPMRSATNYMITSAAISYP